MGLTEALATALPSSTAGGWRDRAGAVVHLAVAIVLGAVNLSEAEQVGLHHRPLFGPAVSDSTARRALAAAATAFASAAPSCAGLVSVYAAGATGQPQRA